MDYAVDATIMGLVVALVTLAKNMGFPTRYAALLALVLAVGFVLGREGAYSFDNLVAGLITGLAASGLYSGYKAVTQG